ncbi:MULTISPECIES: hypothetical protein [Bordetella]|uniref:hypothetical protein n=1 Tax=Bordetella TaxID=517 RepID=UPI00045B7485|nr:MULTISPECIES: hypothetical protein [Bordetella]ARP78346.1 hypothetical protein CAL11_20415 [Bordetella genomosp. 6]AWP73645.1 hypothetical protein B7P10_03850 [Bordetella bronchiseptica]KCV60802.1 hypothetical protein L493_0718 [Bordetella bronchiseptica 99-R-0433]KDB73453.1 hypothetical protein L494_0783 [Bordetella bronchiseptica CA90 BB1334]KDB97988.1 hypothetical protein AZ18_0780 [Bordetella bronchiseptica D993]
MPRFPRLSGRRWQLSRKRSLQLFALSLLVLAAAAYSFHGARQDLDHAYGALSLSERQRVQTTQELAVARKEAERADAARRILASADATGFAAGGWSERRISIQQSAMTRHAVNDLLREASTGTGRLFGAEQFDLSVTRPEDGLFHATSGNNPDVVLTLRGTLLFRLDR